MSEILKANIGRFDSTLQQVGFREGDKIRNLLEKAGLTLGQGESVNDDEGEEVSLSDEAEETDYYIVANQKNA